MKLAILKQGLCQGYFAFLKACYFIENDTKMEMTGVGLNRLSRTWQILFNDKLWHSCDKKCHLVVQAELPETGKHDELSALLGESCSFEGIEGILLLGAGRSLPSVEMTTFLAWQ